MLKRIISILLSLTVIFSLSSCSSIDSGDQQIYSVQTTYDTVYSSVTTTDNFSDETTDNTEINLSETEETSIHTTSAEYAIQLVNSVELPKVDINENSTSEEIMHAGKIMAIFFAEKAEMYFGYGVENLWKLSYKDNDIFDNGVRTPYQTAGAYRKSLGLYAGTKDIYIPMNGEESKQFLIDYIGLTEKGYEELCENSPSTYMIKDGKFYVSSGDGGQAGWDYSYIIDYEMDENTITYNCARIGRKERWGYDEDLICPFTFRLALENGVWKLDGCSYGEGFFYWLIGLENDIETYLANSEDWQENVINDEN